MNRKRRNRHAVLLLLAVLLIPAVAHADFGPKPHVEVTVVNPPREEYYLDLLVQERGAGGLIPYSAEEYAARGLDAAMFELLFSLADEGWFPVLAGDGSLPWAGKMAGRPDRNGREHYFSRTRVDDTCRIIVVTASGAVRVSEPVERHTFHVNMTYDYANNRVSLRSLAFAYLAQFASTCIPTLLIEGLLLRLFGFSFKKSGKVFLITNVATQVFLTATLGTALLFGSLLGMYYFVIPAEIVITIAEAMVFTRLFTEQTKQQRRLYAIMANLVSFLAGLYLSAYVATLISFLT